MVSNYLRFRFFLFALDSQTCIQTPIIDCFSGFHFRSCQVIKPRAWCLHQDVTMPNPRRMRLPDADAEASAEQAILEKLEEACNDWCFFRWQLSLFVKPGATDRRNGKNLSILPWILVLVEWHNHIYIYYLSSSDSLEKWASFSKDALCYFPGVYVLDTSNVGTCWNLSTSRSRFGTTKVKLRRDMCFSQRAHPVDSSMGLDDCQMMISYDFITLCASETFLGEIQFPATTSHKSRPGVFLLAWPKMSSQVDTKIKGFQKELQVTWLPFLTRSVLKRRMWV